MHLPSNGPARGIPGMMPTFAGLRITQQKINRDGGDVGTAVAAGTTATLSTHQVRVGAGVIALYGFAIPIGAAGRAGYFMLYRDSTLVAYQRWHTNDGQASQMAFCLDQPGPGIYTYTLKVDSDSGSGGSTTFKRATHYLAEVV